MAHCLVVGVLGVGGDGDFGFDAVGSVGVETVNFGFDDVVVDGVKGLEHHPFHSVLCLVIDVDGHWH